MHELMTASKITLSYLDESESVLLGKQCRRESILLCLGL